MLPPVQLMGTGMRVVSSNNKFTEASFQITDKPLDLAIDGRGFLQVLQPDGTLAYTRNGQLQINGQGELVTNNGLLIEPGIVIPEDATNISISQDGVVNAHFPGDPQDRKSVV